MKPPASRFAVCTFERQPQVGTARTQVTALGAANVVSCVRTRLIELTARWSLDENERIRCKARSRELMGSYMLGSWT